MRVVIPKYLLKSPGSILAIGQMPE